ncbi:MAG: heterodisulfide reductase [Desulfobacteraceae bacterium]|nr:heterodisulfide reductase [Desulfobacteraceae bacterium]
MYNNKQIPSENINFAHEVKNRSGIDFNLCYHCQSCAGGCPFVKAMDFHPYAVIRLVQLGMQKEALECSAIWICVGCHTCAVQCPMSIDMSAVMDALRQMALEQGAVVAEDDVLEFHREVLNSIERYGRTHKLEIMMRYKIRKREWFSDMNVGIKMLAKRKLDLTPSRVRNIDEIRKLFHQSREGHHEE